MVSPNTIGASQWPSLATEEILYNLATKKIMNSMNLKLHQSLSSESSSPDSASKLLGNGIVPQNQGTVFNQSSSSSSVQQQMDLDGYLAHDGQVMSIPDPLSMIPLNQSVSCSRYHVGIEHENQELNVAVPISDSDFHVPEVKFKVDIPVPGKTLDAEKKTHSSLDEKRRKSLEKRERRMIKNRESAARSRARKQAYTKHLEHDVQQLKTMNDLLKRRTELQRKWSSSSTLEPCRCPFRRTNSL